jgi:8-oxo-dGTP diphosphatase
LPGDPKEFAWNLFTELRKELVELQRIRSQISIAKLTVVTATIGLILANYDKIPGLILSILLILPFLVSVTFDYLANGYSYSIKRTGYYCREYLEPILKAEHGLPPEFEMWEHLMAGPKAGAVVSKTGHLGLTGLAALVAVPGLAYLFYYAARHFTLEVQFDLPMGVGIAGGIVAIVACWFLLDRVWKDINRPNELSTRKENFVFESAPRVGVAVLVTRLAPTGAREVLVAVRRFEPHMGKLDFPGGFVKSSESAEQAARREILEETGLEVGKLTYLGSAPDDYGDTGLKTLNPGYEAEYIGGEEKAKDDVADLKWFVYTDEATPFPEMAFAHQATLLLWLKNPSLRPVSGWCTCKSEAPPPP